MSSCLCDNFWKSFELNTYIYLLSRWQRITTAEVIENEWFKKGYVAPRFEQEEISLVDVDAIFNEASVTFAHLLLLQLYPFDGGYIGFFFLFAGL